MMYRSHRKCIAELYKTQYCKHCRLLHSDIVAFQRETVLGMQRCCGKYQRSDNDVGSHATCKQVLPGRTGWTLHYVGFGGLGGKGNSRQAIGYQIDPQYVDGQQWDRHAQDRGEGDGENFRQVTRQHILDELPDVFVYASSFFDCLDDSRE